MRKINSEFKTHYLSQEGHKPTNRDYFRYVELDDYACYVLADSLDEDMEANTARYIVESLICSFMKRPTMSKSALSRYMHQVNKDLERILTGMRLKASVVMVVTDYRKLRFCYVGNSRFYLIRNGRYLYRTRGQSLTRSLIEEEKKPMDLAAIYEEKNNLYSYFGEWGNPKVVVSPIIKLENSDIIAQLTRNVWENCSDEELMEAVGNAKESKDILDQVEDMILGKQEVAEEIDNYTLAVTLVRKTYQSPKKNITQFFSNKKREL